MNSRIALVLKAKNISPSQLADDLGVQRSGISHIVNGRNKPSLDFIQKLIRLYPDISMQWILFGEGPMMNPFPEQRNEVSSGNPSASFKEEKPKPLIMELFSTEDDRIVNDGLPEEERLTENISQAFDIQENIIPEIANEIDSRKTNLTESASDHNPELPQAEQRSPRKESRKAEPVLPEVENKKPEQPARAVRTITKILVFYNDRTFVEYKPGQE